MNRSSLAYYLESLVKTNHLPGSEAFGFASSAWYSGNSSGPVDSVHACCQVRL